MATTALMPNESLTQLDVAFSGSVRHLLPAWEDIPEEFRKGWSGGNRWCDFVGKLFFEGGKLPLALPGINQDAAYRHIRVCLGSFEPKHEHKTAGVAYLMSLWLSPPWSEKAEKKKKGKRKGRR